jgi:hypothetical protein
MYLSDRFIRNTEKMIRKNREKPEDELIAMVRKNFFSAASEVPEECRHQIFNHFVNRYLEQRADNKLHNMIRSLGEVVDLFRKEYDERNDPLEDEDWEVIRNCVKECAGDMDMSVVTYIMKLLVSTHRM